MVIEVACECSECIMMQESKHTLFLVTDTLLVAQTL